MEPKNPIDDVENIIIIDYAEARDFDAIPEGVQGDCFGTFDPEDTDCTQVCLNSDECAKYALNKIEIRIAKIAKAAMAAKTVEEPAMASLPLSFKQLEVGLEGLSRIQKVAKKTRVNFMHGKSKFATILPPIKSTNIIIRLYNCTREELDDPKGLLYDSDPKYPGVPFLLVGYKDWKSALNILEQLHKKFETSKKLFKEDKYAKSRRRPRKNSQKETKQS